VKLDEKGLPEGVTDTISFPAINGKVSHPHMISFDPAGKKVYLTDLGLDRIVIYDFDAVSGHLKQIENGIVDLPAGQGHDILYSTLQERNCTSSVNLIRQLLSLM